MVQTRRSLPSRQDSTADTASASSAAAPHSVAKRPRGRPSKASLAAAAAAAAAASASRDSLSSTTSKRSSTEPISGYSTPLTSNVATPVPDKTNNGSTASTRSAQLEVVIPAIKARDSPAQAIQKAKDYMLGSNLKRKHEMLEIANSEDEDDLSPDDKVARRLQEEFDREAAEAYLSEDDASQNQESNDNDDDHEEHATDSKGKGKAVAHPRPSRATRVTAKTIIPDSEDYDDENEHSDSLDFSRPTKKQKTSFKGKGKTTTKGKGKMITPSLLSDSESEVSVRVRHQNARKANDDSATSDGSELSDSSVSLDDSEGESEGGTTNTTGSNRFGTEMRRGYRRYANRKGVKTVRAKLETNHPELKTMWKDLKRREILKPGKAEQPKNITRILKPFQLEGLAWMKAMEQTDWKGGLLGDEMGLGKTIQAVSLIMSDWPAKQPTLVLVPPVALMQWASEIDSYTDGSLKTLVFHGTNSKAKSLKMRELKKYDVIMMSYNSLESMYRKQEKGFKRKDGMHREKSLIHAINFHRVILDEAHCIKTRSTMTAKACFALKVQYRWCLTGTPLQNRIGEFFSLIRFLQIKPFSSYFCKTCPCETLEWSMDDNHCCTECSHNAMQHVSTFNQELLNPIQRFGNVGKGADAFRKLRMMTDRIMLRRLKKDHTDSMDLPVKEVIVDRQFFGEAENDFANSIMTNGQRKFDTYVAHGVLLNNYANIFGLIMQMRQVADHPDLLLKKNAEGGANILHCCICDEPAEEAIRSRCKHDFCRTCAKAYLNSQDQPDCPRCHIPLSIDLEQPEIEQDEALVKKSSIINRIKMENWTSSSKIELLVHELHKLRSDKATHKSIIFSQFTTMLQLIEWRLRRAGITTVMLDGSMTPAQRAASIDHFMKNVDVEVFLVSLKAGGVALNLTEASRVYIVDPWWNPAAEWQSADRCHRIGQTRPCTITRLCIEDSVESRMVLLQEKKTKMINSTINSDDAAMESLSPEDLQFLFRGS